MCKKIIYHFQRNIEKTLGSEINFWKTEMIAIKQSNQNNVSFFCLWSGNQKCFIRVILIKKVVDNENF